jgi:hypothetical protein
LTLSGMGITLNPATRGGRTASFLNDASMSVGGTEYKYYETVWLPKTTDATTAGYYLGWGDLSAAGTYESYYKDNGVTVPGSDVKYRLMFDTAVPLGSANLTGKTIKFLGTDYTVTSSDATTIKLSQAGGTVLMNVGDTKTIGGFTVKLLAVGRQGSETKVALDVGGVGVTVTAGQTETITVGGVSLPVFVKSALEVTGGGSAEVLVGATTFELKNGQELKGYPGWMVNFAVTSNALSHINITYTNPHSSYSGTYPVIATGGAEIKAPTDFFKLKSLGWESRSLYKLQFTPTVADFNGDATAAESGIKITITADGSATKVFDVGGGFSADAIAYDVTNGYWRYQNTTGGWSPATSRPSIAMTEGTANFYVFNTTGSVNTSVNPGTGLGFGASSLVLTLNEPLRNPGASTGNWFIEYAYVSGTDPGTFANVTNVATFGGASSDPTYLSYNATAADNKAIAYGGTSPKSRTAFVSNYGTVYKSASSSSIILDVPRAQNYIDFLVGRESGTATVAGTTTSDKIMPVTADIAMLDTEVTDNAAADMVVVGGPCINKIAAALLNATYPVCGDDAKTAGIPENAALVQVFKDKFATGKSVLLIAGWEAANSDVAARVVQDGTKLATITGDKATVTGTNFATVTVA